MEKRTIFFILNYGGAAVRNVIGGGLLQKLVEKNYRVVLFELTDHDKISTKNFYKEEDVVIDSLGEIVFRGPLKFIQRLLTYIWRTKVPYEKFLTFWGKKKTIRHSFQNVLGRLLNPIPFWIWDKLIKKTTRWKEGDSLFSRYNPVAVLISNPADKQTVATTYAQKKGIYTASVLESWDNLCVRGAVYAYPDDLLVWNELIARQAIELHKFPKERVHAMGIPSFDLYAHPNGLPSEAEWRKIVGLPEDVPIVVYSTSSQQTYSNEDSVIDSLLLRKEEGRLPENVHFLIRLHPRDNFSQYDKYKKVKDITIQYPDADFKDDSRNDMSLGRPTMLSATMRYAAVVINVFSTICLDALANGAPVVAISFDSIPVSAPEKSVRRVLNFPHIKELLQFNAISIAHNAEELIDYILVYLNDRSYNIENREKCLKAQIHDLKGGASERIADFIDQRIKTSVNLFPAG